MDQHYGLTQTVAPTSEPVTLDEAKEWCHVDSDDTTQDAVINGLIKAARQTCERVAGLSLITQTWKLEMDEWPDEDVIYLPRPPLQSVSSITYVDTSGVTQTITASNYRVDAVSTPGRVEPAYGYTWPVVRDVSGTIKVTYVAGYGLAAAVPDDIKERLCAYVAHRFERRDEFDQGWLDGLFTGFWSGDY